MDKEHIRILRAEVTDELRTIRRELKARMVRAVQVVRAILSREAPK